MGARDAVGVMLKGHRLAAGLTQEALAERAGISPRSIQAIESGTNKPFRETLQRLAAALHLSEAEREALSVAAQRPPRRVKAGVPEGSAERPLSAQAGPASLSGLPPTSPTPLLGRESELALVATLLGRTDTRLITLTGPGGVGKTRLALDIRASTRATFADGVVFVDLTPLTDPQLVLATIAGTMGVVAVSGQPLQISLARALEGRHRLIILDNCEHMVDAAPEVATLLANCPTLHVLATSRIPLRLRSERVISIQPLPVPTEAQLSDLNTLGSFAAINLFVQQAQARHADFALSGDNSAAVAEICRRLEGLPLAIELAAARVVVLPPHALLERLDTNARRTHLSILTGGARDLPPRHRTLRDTIAWSYALLTPREQALFRGLCAFSGGCTLEAAEQVYRDDGGDSDAPTTSDTLDVLGALVEKNLLRMVEQPNGHPRYVMLGTIRDFGREELTASGNEAALLQRHATYFLDLADDARLHLHHAEQVVWLNRLGQEIDNLRAMFTWCVEQGRAGDQAATDRGLWAAGCLLRYWLLRTHHREGRAWLTQLLALPGATAHTLARARALRVAGMLEGREADLAQGRALCEESIALCRALGEKRELGHALSNFSLFLDLWPDGTASSKATYRAALEEAIALYRQTQYPGGIGGALVFLSRADLVDGEIERAEENATSGLAMARESGDHWYAAYACEVLAGVARARGNLTLARQRLEERLRIDRALDHWNGVWSTLEMLGEIAQDTGDADTARHHYTDTLSAFRETGDTRLGIRALAGLALLAADAGDVALGLSLAAGATALANARGTMAPPTAQARLAAVHARAQQVLGAEEAAAIWQAGSAMTQEQTIVTALNSCS